eukprot:scaffold102189_cov64-Attheya_sp.AAC.3
MDDRQHLQYLFYREARRNAPNTGCVHSGTKQHFLIGCQLHLSVIQIVLYLQSNAILVSVGWVGCFGCIITDSTRSWAFNHRVKSSTNLPTLALILLFIVLSQSDSRSARAEVNVEEEFGQRLLLMPT